jgi:hypothetical protein
MYEEKKGKREVSVLRKEDFEAWQGGAGLDL